MVVGKDLDWPFPPTDREKSYRTSLAIHFYGSGTVKAGVRVRHGHWKGGYTNFGSQRILSFATEKSRIMYESVCGFTTSSTPED